MILADQADQSSVAPCAMLTVRREARSDLVGPCALNAPSQPCKPDTGKRLAEVDANDDDSSQTASRSRNKRQRPLVSNDLEPCVATDSATSSAPTRMPAEWKELDRQLRFVVSSCPLPIASSQLPVRLQNVRDRGNCALALMKDAYKFISVRTFVLASNIFDKFLSAYVREAQDPDTDCHDDTHFSCKIQIPVACFLIACKFVETFAPALRDCARLVKHDCTAHDIASAELTVLATLGWDVNIVTGVDILHKLLSFVPQPIVARLKDEAERHCMLACCSWEIMSQSNASDLALGVLIYACEKENLHENVLLDLPRFMFTSDSFSCSKKLRAFIHSLTAKRGQARSEIM